MYASVLGSQILRTLVSVLGFFSTRRVVDFPRIIRGNMNRMSFSPIASIAFWSTRASSLFTMMWASSFAISLSEMWTQSQVKPVISPSLSEQANARLMAINSFPSEQLSSACRITSTVQISRIFFSFLGSSTSSKGFLGTISQRTAWRKAQCITLQIFSIVHGGSVSVRAFRLGVLTGGVFWSLSTKLSTTRRLISWTLYSPRIGLM